MRYPLLYEKCVRKSGDFHRALMVTNDPWKRHKSPACPAHANARGRPAPDLGLLNYIAHEPYIRAPWKINDDLPGIRSAEYIPPPRQSSIRLWPNPAQHTVWVELPHDLSLTKAYLQNMDGRRINAQTSGNAVELPLMAAGTYFLHFTLSNGVQHHHKLNVQP